MHISPSCAAFCTILPGVCAPGFSNNSQERSSRPKRRSKQWKSTGRTEEITASCGKHKPQNKKNKARMMRPGLMSNKNAGTYRSTAAANIRETNEIETKKNKVRDAQITRECLYLSITCPVFNKRGRVDTLYHSAWIIQYRAKKRGGIAAPGLVTPIKTSYAKGTILRIGWE